MKTDLELKDDIIDELDFDPAVNAAHIGVTVSSGVVTLVGQISTYVEKHAAMLATQRVAGVRAVALELEVVLTSDHARGDTDIAQAAEVGLIWSAMVPSERIQIIVDNGFVTLTGDVDWEYQRKAAANSVMHLIGVRGLKNKIQVKAHASKSDVGLAIESALKRQAEREAHRIAVEIDGATVTLRGKVRTTAEAIAAVGAAYNAAGVSRVVDELELI